MTDILAPTKCGGVKKADLDPLDCQLRETCKRFTAKPSSFQTYYFTAPFIDTKVLEENVVYDYCEFYIVDEPKIKKEKEDVLGGEST